MYLHDAFYKESCLKGYATHKHQAKPLTALECRLRLQSRRSLHSSLMLYTSELQTQFLRVA